VNILKSVNIWQSYINQEGGCLMHFVCLATTLAARRYRSIAARPTSRRSAAAAAPQLNTDLLINQHTVHGKYLNNINFVKIQMHTNETGDEHLMPIFLKIYIG